MLFTVTLTKRLKEDSPESEDNHKVLRTSLDENLYVVR